MIAANGTHALRDIANVTMDLNGIERIQFNALGGTDIINVGDLTGTGVTQVDIDLAATLGGTTPDGQLNTVFVNGTGNASGQADSNGNWTIQLSAPLGEGTYAITASSLKSPNYIIASADGTLTITPAPLTITTADASKVYGQPNPAFTASYIGLVNGDTASSLGGTVSFRTLAGAGSPAGTYRITPAPLTVTANNATSVSTSPIAM